MTATVPNDVHSPFRYNPSGNQPADLRITTWDGERTVYCEAPKHGSDRAWLWFRDDRPGHGGFQIAADLTADGWRALANAAQARADFPRPTPRQHPDADGDLTMGLDLRADGSDLDAHWSYSGFNAFRTRLAATQGIDLDQMDGFGGELRPWDDLSSPLVPLLQHSDCDGEMTPAECGRVEPTLRVAVWALPVDDYDRHQGERLADLMAHCALTSVPLIFG